MNGYSTLEQARRNVAAYDRLRTAVAALAPMDERDARIDELASAIFEMVDVQVRPMPPCDQVEKVRRAIFNVLTREAEVNTGMMLAAVYEALGFPGIDHPAPRHMSDKAEVVEGCECAICKMHRK